MLASTMLGAHADEMRQNSRRPENQSFLYDKASDDELDRMIANLEQEKLQLDPSDTEGHALYQRQFDRMIAAKKRRHGQAMRRSARPRASALLGGLGPSAKNTPMSAGY